MQINGTSPDDDYSSSFDERTISEKPEMIPMQFRSVQVLCAWPVVSSAAWVLIATQSALWAATSFVHETVDATGDVGQYASLVLARATQR